MKLSELKEQAQYTWEVYHNLHNAVVQTDRFLEEVAKIGDLDSLDTWKVFYARFAAWVYIDSGADYTEIITYYLNFVPGNLDYEVRDLIIDEFLAHPDGLEIFKMALEDVVFAGEQKEIYGKLLELVGVEQGSDRTTVRATRLVWELDSSENQSEGIRPDPGEQRLQFSPG